MPVLLNSLEDNGILTSMEESAQCVSNKRTETSLKKKTSVTTRSFQCHSVQDLQVYLRQLLDADTPSFIPAFTTGAFVLEPSLRLQIARNGQSAPLTWKGDEEKGLIPSTEAAESNISNQGVAEEIDIADAVNISYDNGRVKVQRAVCRVLVKAICDVDEFAYGIRNDWMSKDGARYQYTCNDSLQNKDRVSNRRDSKMTNGNKSSGYRPTYDCGGLLTFKFSVARSSIEIVYGHSAIHRSSALHRAQDSPSKYIPRRRRPQGGSKHLQGMPTPLIPMAIHKPDNPTYVNHRAQEHNGNKAESSSEESHQMNGNRNIHEFQEQDSTFTHNQGVLMQRQDSSMDHSQSHMQLTETAQAIRDNAYKLYVKNLSTAASEQRVSCCPEWLGGSEINASQSRLQDPSLTVNGTPRQEGVFEHRPDSPAPPKSRKAHKIQKGDFSSMVVIPRSKDIPCNPCRNKHVKCDHTHPICVNCQAGNKSCQYPEIKKRGRKSIKSSARSTESPLPVSHIEVSTRPQIPEGYVPCRPSTGAQPNPVQAAPTNHSNSMSVEGRLLQLLTKAALP
ncbi:MAG: hypothetical protein M1827_006672 [Pycnora praestabilis]|nr:MAG: hypothetical protein M1827_006672 [Pycnora praestabilis]